MNREARFLTIGELSAWLQVKPGTLYAWANQGKIPHHRIHKLIRFQSDEIKHWLVSFQAKNDKPLKFKTKISVRPSSLDSIIVRAKEEAYNSRHGETRQRSSPIGKEAADGAV